MRESTSHTASSAEQNAGQIAGRNVGVSNDANKSINAPQSLALRNLCIANGEKILLEGVGFEIVAGETTALMGESGSGKSLSALALQGITPRNLRRISGEVLLDGRVLNEREIAQGRGKLYSSILQNPRTCFNPLLSLKSHIKESLNALGKGYVSDEVERALSEVGLESSALFHYPHELSGGMLQRAMIAISLLSGARFIIADEATTDLDMVVERRILELLKKLQKERGLGLLLISHDRRVVEFMSDRVYVIERGRMCDNGGNLSLGYDGNLSAGIALSGCNLSLGMQFSQSFFRARLDEFSHSICGGTEKRLSKATPQNTSIVGNGGQDLKKNSSTYEGEAQNATNDSAEFVNPAVCHTGALAEVSQNEHSTDFLEAKSKRYFAFAQYDKETSDENSVGGNNAHSPSPSDEIVVEGVRGWAESRDNQQNALIAHNVSKSFSRYTLFGRKQKRVLRAVSLRVGERERVALLGRSGSGKSTLAKILSGLEDFDRDFAYKVADKSRQSCAHSEFKADFGGGLSVDFGDRFGGGLREYFGDFGAGLRGGVYLNGKEIWQTKPRYTRAKNADLKNMRVENMRGGNAGAENVGVNNADKGEQNHANNPTTKNHNAGQNNAICLANLLERRGFYKQVQILFQDPIGSLNPRLTLRESLCVPLRYLLDVSDKEAQEARILPLLARMGLDEGLLEAYPAMLSGGQAARFCLARALLARPKYIILDESTSSLDERAEGEILALLKELQEENGLGVLLITHSVELARKFCEKIYIMESGEIIEEVLGSEPFRSDFGAELDRLSAFA